MDCPYCQGASKVVDSRPMPDGIRRRRECKASACGRRFTTHERLAPIEIRVVKSGSRSTEPFSSSKLTHALERVTSGTPLTERDLRTLARQVELELLEGDRTTVSTQEIARRILTHLERLDRLAFERMAVNYRTHDGRIDLAPLPEAEAPERQFSLFDDEL